MPLQAEDFLKIFYYTLTILSVQVAVYLPDEILTIAKYIYAATCDSCKLFDNHSTQCT